MQLVGREVSPEYDWLRYVYVMTNPSLEKVEVTVWAQSASKALDVLVENFPSPWREFVNPAKWDETLEKINA